jgi:hypothetical protein
MTKFLGRVLKGGSLVGFLEEEYRGRDKGIQKGRGEARWTGLGWCMETSRGVGNRTRCGLVLVEALWCLGLDVQLGCRSLLSCFSRK